jgi:transcription elongation factor Elf1
MQCPKCGSTNLEASSEAHVSYWYDGAVWHECLNGLYVSDADASIKCGDCGTEFEAYVEDGLET